MPKRPEKTSSNGKFMSNAKWRKFFAAVESSGLVISESLWTYVGDSRSHKHRGLPKLSEVGESGLKDGRWQPISFSEIHTIIIPRTCDDPRQDQKRTMPSIEQPIEELGAVLRSAGHFPFSVTESGLVITAYAA
jgi:hypothetical protein